MNSEAKIERCECGNVICVRDPSDGNITVKKQGRIIEIVGADSVTITCERCGEKNIFLSPQFRLGHTEKMKESNDKSGEEQ